MLWKRLQTIAPGSYLQTEPAVGIIWLLQKNASIFVDHVGEHSIIFIAVLFGSSLPTLVTWIRLSFDQRVPLSRNANSNSWLMTYCRLNLGVTPYINWARMFLKIKLNFTIHMQNNWIWRLHLDPLIMSAAIRSQNFRRSCPFLSIFGVLVVKL